MGAGDIPVPAANLRIAGQNLTTAATNAYLAETYVALPAGAAQLLPFSVTGPNAGAFSFDGRAEPGLMIVDGNTGQDLTGQTNTVIVGQPMNLILKTSTTNGPALSNFHWSVPGFTVTNFYVSTDSFQTNGYPILLAATNNQNINFWWVNGATNRSVQCSATVLGQTVTASAVFNVLRPTGKIFAQTGAVAINNLEMNLELGFINAPSYPTAGILFSNTVTMPPGTNYNWGNANYETEWVQLVTSPSPMTITTTTGTNVVVHTRETSGIVLDSAYPYPNAYPFTGKITVDAPFVTLAETNETSASDTQISKMWLMFKPDGGQWVPLRTVSWNWSGGANLSGTNWLLSASSWSTNPPDADAGTAYPTWTNNIANTNSFGWNPPL